MERADSRRGLPNNATSCGFYSCGYGIQARHRSLGGCPGADTYDDRSSLSLSDRYSPAVHAYAYADPDRHAHADRDRHGHPYAHAHADPDFHAHPYARLQRRTIPELGVAILR